MTTPSPQPQISELTSELTDERNTGESASQLLDAETAERLRAEKEMEELQVRAGPGGDSRASGHHALVSVCSHRDSWPGTPVHPG